MHGKMCGALLLAVGLHLCRKAECVQLRRRDHPQCDATVHSNNYYDNYYYKHHDNYYYIAID